MAASNELLNRGPVTLRTRSDTARQTGRGVHASKAARPLATSASVGLAAVLNVELVGCHLERLGQLPRLAGANGGRAVGLDE